MAGTNPLRSETRPLGARQADSCGDPKVGTCRTHGTVKERNLTQSERATETVPRQSCKAHARVRTANYFVRTVLDSGAILCEFDDRNARCYVIRDVGLLNVEGNEWCHSLAAGVPPRW